MSVPTILVVEDDSAVRQGVVDALTFAGYEVLSVSDGRAGREAALSARYDLLLLDLILPHFTGFDILEALQESRAGQAVIILSAKGEENDRIKGLKMGADDYVMKPFSARELLARVDAVLRRTTERQALSGKYEVAGRVIDISGSEIVYEGERHELSERKIGVLKYLIANPGRPVPRDELLRHVWGIDPNRIETRTVDMHVSHIRKKLGDHSQEILETVRGRGYRLAHTL
ncbi:response regulator transcription factor [Akkermansiaceae bacterium]|nr:response regulator transcription factor [Akkermansiaceae bacterium]MDB4542009.1 response regulator transcription factor [bacterium]MDA7929488.1 response regulator transcription factor [Akkermansiaceae bacterium]MDA7934266.1 response regulator transcription factor [Akkermansiaceae bacterium]MDA9831469.1 response regulator transcription factor [Akkermansiaceae bacterium]